MDDACLLPFHVYDLVYPGFGVGEIFINKKNTLIGRSPQLKQTKDYKTLLNTTPELKFS